MRRVAPERAWPADSTAGEILQRAGLSAWWIRLGIRPERMHRTLKEAAVVPPAATLAAQQQRFNAFVSEYNAERSHEALQRRTPRELYTASPRNYPAKLPPVLAKEPIGLHPIDEFRWEVRCSFHLLGVLNERNQKINPPGQWHG